MTIWAVRDKPTTSWAWREQVETSRSGRDKPETSWASRTEVDTSRAVRNRPIIYKAPLQDAYRIVHDQDDRIVYILTNSWTEIPWTFWKTRPLVS